MEATKLIGTILCTNFGVMFLEFFNPEKNVFEYYLREDSRHDFEYKFGVTETFSAKQLTQLYDQGYFD